MIPKQSAESADPLRDEPSAAMLTAHALGQLEGAEQADVERQIADPARHKDRETVAEVRRLAEVLRADRLADGMPRSTDLRRAVVAAIAVSRGDSETAAPPSAVVAMPQSARRSVAWWLAVAGSLAAAILVMVTAVRTQSTQHWGGRAPVGREIAQRLPMGRPGDDESVLRDEKMEAPPKPQSAPELAGKKASEQHRRLERQSAVTETDKRSESISMAAAPAAPGHVNERKGLQESEVDGKAANGMLAKGIASAKPERSDSDYRNRSSVPPPLAASPMARDAREFGSEGFERTKQLERQGDSERYAQLTENRPRLPADDPLSTFSIDVDTASYANVRRFLASGRLPPRDAVRIEELVNYFRYDYPQPAADKPFSVTLEVAACPWHAGRRLVRIGLQGRDIDRRERPAGNLVFLIDVSGSMAAANKLPLVKQALSMLVEELTENDSVAIVTYAGDAGLKLPATSGDQKQTILAAISGLSSGGSTHGSAGINMAYEQAAERFIAGGVNRVILATDGDLNVGVTGNEALVDLIRQKAAGGTFLTVLGFGEGNLQDEKMEKIADNGNGVYAYIDGAREARKVLVEQLTGSTITIAKDVKIQVEFNPAQVLAYRLLGYENRLMAAEDFRNDKKDAGEIGAGHSVTAIYEITLAGGADGGTATGAEPLKYQPQPAAAAQPVEGKSSRELLTVKLRSKRPDGDTSVLEESALTDRGGSFAEASVDLRFAAAVAGFGMILRGSDQKGEATLPMVAAIAASALGPDQGGYRAEFLDLVRKAQALRDGGE